MYRLRASLTAALLVAATLMLSGMLSGPAAAGGPTSALLSVPGEGATASLYYTDPEYDALADLVGISSPTGTGKEGPPGFGHENGPGVTVTWLIHDVMPWRVDRIYLEGKGAPWIATQVTNGDGAIWDSPVVWAQPASPGALVALLDRLGVGEASREAGAFNGVAGAPTSPETVPVRVTEETPADASPFAGIGWGLGGLAAGIVLTVLWVRRTRADADPWTASGSEDTAAPGLVGAEELIWPAPRG